MRDVKELSLYLCSGFCLSKCLFVQLHVSQTELQEIQKKPFTFSFLSDRHFDKQKPLKLFIGVKKINGHSGVNFSFKTYCAQMILALGSFYFT